MDTAVNGVIQVKIPDYQFGVQFVQLILFMYVSPFFSHENLTPMIVYTIYDSTYTDIYT